MKRTNWIYLLAHTTDGVVMGNVKLSCQSQTLPLVRMLLRRQGLEDHVSFSTNGTLGLNGRPGCLSLNSGLWIFS